MKNWSPFEWAILLAVAVWGVSAIIGSIRGDTLPESSGCFVRRAPASSDGGAP